MQTAQTAAERQHGVASRRQMLAAGVGARAINHQIARGFLHPVHTGVYAVGRPALTQHGLWMAAVLACGDGAALSHRSSAELWRLCEPLAHLIQVTVPRGRNARHRDLVIHRRELDASDVTRCENIRATTPNRTLLDTAAYLPTSEVDMAVNEAVKLDLVDLEHLRAWIDRLPPLPGKAILRELVDRRTFRVTDSELERLFLRLVRQAGLPMPKTGQVIAGLKTDFFWPRLRLVVETDGLRFHREPSQQARDRRRDQVLTANGMTVLRFTHWQVTREPAQVIATLRQVMRRLSTLPG